MINELAVATISLAFFFGGGDEKASSVKGESPFTCAQINEAAGNQNHGAVAEMLRLSLQRLDRSYTSDRTIDLFYQNRLRGDREQYIKLLGMQNYLVLSAVGTIDRYTNLLTTSIVDTCIEKPKLGVLDAATKVLNDTYQIAKTQPFYAICKAYNENTVSYESLMNFVSEPRTEKYFNNVRVLEVRAMSSYGDAYFQAEVSRLCADKPVEPLIELLVSMSESAYQTEMRRQEQEQIARDKAASEVMKKELAKLEFELEFKRYSTSLYTNKDEDITCNSYTGQYNKVHQAEDVKHKKAYEAGLLETIKDAINLIEADRREALLAKLSDGSINSESVRDACRYMNYYDSFLSVFELFVPIKSESFEGPMVVKPSSSPLVIRGVLAGSTYAASQTSEAEIVTAPGHRQSERIETNQPTESRQEPTIDPRSELDRTPRHTAQSDPFNRIAVINDPDGYTNVRASANGKIISRILENERFHTYEQQGNWWSIRKADGLLGYVHKSRITIVR